MRFYVLALLAALATPVAADDVSARYEQPTGRYGHGALGPDHEFARLVITAADGTVRAIDLPEALVFEDTAPRLADLDGDGTPEIVVVESHTDLGARIAIYNTSGQRIAASPHIGTRFRWLAIAGIADFGGDGVVEIAAVDRPHLARVLRYWVVEGDLLREVASFPRVTNHRFGTAEIEGGVRLCDDLPELILADATWRRILAVRWDGEAVTTVDQGFYAGPHSLTRALDC